MIKFPEVKPADYKVNFSLFKIYLIFFDMTRKGVIKFFYQSQGGDVP